MNKIIDFLPTLISLASLIIALLSYNSHRAKICFLSQMTSEKILDFEQIKVISKNKQSFNQVLLPFPKGVLKRINILNPSPVDVAYFNLHATIDNQELEVYTQNSFAYLPKPYVFEYTRSNGWTGEIPIPSSPQGKFKANSNNTFYLFVPFDKMLYLAKHLPKKCTIEFSYALRTFHRPFMPYTTKKIEIDPTILKEWSELQLLTNRQHLLPIVSNPSLFLTYKPLIYFNSIQY